MAFGAGPIVLLGSGETSATLRAAYEWLLKHYVAPVQVAILETPAGFELNSAQVAARVGDFVEKHLINHKPQVSLVPARMRGTPNSPDNAEILHDLWQADVVFAGPGSPSYAVRQLRDSLAWEIILARQRLGAGIVLSSAATIAAGSLALPVYELYKVGEELHWKAGLDMLAAYGLQALFVPHWNNTDGGAELDTSRCFMGISRFEKLLDLLPADADRLIVGIDELTALCLDFQEKQAHVLGKGGATVLRAGQETTYASGAAFSMRELGIVREPDDGEGIRQEVWCEARRLARAPEDAVPQELPAEIRALATARQDARRARDWLQADTLREQLRAAGWEVQDTEDGQVVTPLHTA